MKIGNSEIHKMTIGDMNLLQFDTKISETLESTFYVKIDDDGFYVIVDIK